MFKQHLLPVKIIDENLHNIPDDIGVFFPNTCSMINRMRRRSSGRCCEKDGEEEKSSFICSQTLLAVIDCNHGQCSPLSFPFSVVFSRSFPSLYLGRILLRENRR